MRLAHIVAFFLATPLAAAPLSEDVLARMERADIVILGEVHDNPEHHLTEAEAIVALTPSAIVYEMLTPEKASLLSPSTNVTGEELLYVRVVTAPGLAPRQTLVVDVMLPDGRWLRVPALGDGAVLVPDLPHGVAEVDVRL